MIELAILIAILVEIIQSWFDRKNQDKLFKQMLEVMEDSGAELADMRDAVVEEKDGAESN